MKVKTVTAPRNNALRSNTPRLRILVTGGGGFVGSYLLKKLKETFAKDASLFSWDFYSGYNEHSVDNVQFLKVDIRDRTAVEDSIKSIQPTHIVHLAAISHVPSAIRDPFSTFEVNIFGTLNIMEAVKSFCPGAGVIYISSSEVYGASFQEKNALDETAPLQPLNPYAVSKASADLMVGQYAEQGLQVIRLRPFNHIGPGQSEGFVISSFAYQIARIEQGFQERVIKVGNLNTKRDFLDVRDVVSAYVQVIKKIKSLPSGLVMNIASGMPRKISEILDALLSHANCSIEVQLDKSRLRTSDTPITVGLSEKARKLLCWQPKISWESTLISILDWWRERVANTKK